MGLIKTLAMNYHPPFWLPGGHLQTIWSALYAKRVNMASPDYERERWLSPDGDFVDVDWLADKRTGTLLVLFHGLEGSSRSHYSEAFADCAKTLGLAFAVPHFRGCSGELNQGPRAYHSGDYEEIDWILRRFRAQHAGPVIAVGISLGGNALMRWAAEMEEQAAKVVSAVAAICSPLDLTASGLAIGKGFNRQVYTRMFLRSMKPKAMRKLQQYPKLFKAQDLRAVKDLYEFDNVFTAPLHGFKNTDDYWFRASAKPHLRRIRLPALLVNARNDPLVPASSLPTAADVSAHVTLWQPEQGGHVGFAQGRPPGHVRSLPQAVVQWLISAANGKPQSDG